VVDRIKSVVEFVGLLPAVAGVLKWTPRWFVPSPFYEPDILYLAGGLSVVAFLGAYVYFVKVRGPITAWSRPDKNSHFKKACGAFALAAAVATAYFVVVRVQPHSSIGLDLVQQGSWAAFFACSTVGLTALACIWKAS
jgi:hypothetical protein